MDNPIQTNPKKSSISFIAIALLLFSAGATGYFQYQQSQLIPQKALLEKSIKNLEEQLKGNSKDLESQKMVALVEKEQQRIAWSKIMNTITNFESSSLLFQSFKSTNKLPYQIEITGVSTSMKSIQLLLDRIQESSNADTPFIHSLQTNPEKNNEISFNLTFTLK